MESIFLGIDEHIDKINLNTCISVIVYIIYKSWLESSLTDKARKHANITKVFKMHITYFRPLFFDVMVYGHPGSSTVVGGNKNKNKIENSKRQPPYYGGKNMMYYKCTISSWYFVKFCVLFYIFKIFHFYY